MGDSLSSFSRMLSTLRNIPNSQMKIEEVIDTVNEVLVSNEKGVLVTGIFALGMKSLSYLSRAGENHSLPKIELADNYVQLNIDGVKYDTLTNEQVKFEITDSLINAATDNVKEQILPALNLNENTIPSLLAMLSVNGLSEDFIVKSDGSERGTNIPLYYVAYKNGSADFGYMGDGTINIALYANYLNLINKDRSGTELALRTMERLVVNKYISNWFYWRDDVIDADKVKFGLNSIMTSVHPEKYDA